MHFVEKLTVDNGTSSNGSCITMNRTLSKSTFLKGWVTRSQNFRSKEMSSSKIVIISIINVVSVA